MKQFKLALITGASSGIGEALSRRLASEGLNLIISGRHRERLETLKKELEGQVEVEVYPTDLSDRSQRKGLIELLHSRCPDLVINNAGIGLYGPVMAWETSDSLNLIEVNSVAVAELTIEASRMMMQRDLRGTILNVSSVAGFFSFPWFSLYAASKAFVTNLSESMDQELAEYGVRVLAACPGRIATSFGSRAKLGSQAQEEGVHKLKTVFGTMTAEHAVDRILWQIQSGKPVFVFNWVYWLLSWAPWLIPKSLLFKLLRSSMKGRVPPHKAKLGG